MGKPINSETALDHFQSKGYKCVGFIFVKPDDIVVLWNADFPLNERNRIMEEELNGNYREGPPLQIV